MRILEDFDFSGIQSGNEISEERELLLKGFQSYYEKEQMSALFLKACLTAVLSRFIYGADKHRVVFATHEKKVNYNNLMLLQPVFRYVTTHIDKKFSVTELSELVNFSEKYFIHFFKKTIGISPIQYVNQLKMNQARKYIYQGGYTIREISDMLGYSDQYSFSKAFKKHFKVSPTKFK